MKSLTSKPSTQSKKNKREQQVLLALVAYYIQTGKPVSSKMLQEGDLHSLSPATIRNYFVKLETAGYLKQQHTSGGRIPTSKAYQAYAQNFIEEELFYKEDKLDILRSTDDLQISFFLQRASQYLSELTQTAVFLSAPRFDHDFINEIKLVEIDSQRIMCILLTDFGLVHSEVLNRPKNIDPEDLKEVQRYFNWRTQGGDDYINIPEKILSNSKDLYNELMVRYVVNYSNFSHDDIFTTSFSKLLLYPEFGDAYSLASGLSLFEDKDSMRSLLKRCAKMEKLTVWIGQDLATYTNSNENCAVIAVPYRINHKTVGAIALLGPNRLPYREVFSIMRTFSDLISLTLTRLTCKFKIAYREPQEPTIKVKQSFPQLSDKRIS